MADDASIESQIAALKNLPDSVKRRVFFEYCRGVLQSVSAGDSTMEKGAYQICGMSAHVSHVLQPEDQLIVGIACQLELPAAQRGRPATDWQLIAEYVTAALRA